MEDQPNNLTANSTVIPDVSQIPSIPSGTRNPETPTTVIPAKAGIHPVKSTFILLISVSILSFFIVSVYLYLQNQKLSKQISDLQSTPIITPAPEVTPILTPTFALTEEDLSGWSTYVSKYHFSFQYPSELENKKDLLDGAFKKSYMARESKEGTLELSFSVFRNTDDKPLPYDRLALYVDTPGVDLASYIAKNKTDDISVTKKTINSLQVSQWSGYYSNGQAIYQSFENGGRIYNFIVVSPQDGSTEAVQLLSQILSTFKFTDGVIAPTTQLTCPKNGWISCMPILSEEGKRTCSTEAMAWYKKNCPDFKGAAM